MPCPREVAVYLKVSGVIGIALGVVGVVCHTVGIAQGVSGAPVIGRALVSLGALLSGSRNLVLYRKYSRPSKESG